MLVWLLGAKHTTTLGTTDSNAQELKTVVQKARTSPKKPNGRSNSCKLGAIIDAPSASLHSKGCETVDGKDRYWRNQLCADLSKPCDVQHAREWRTHLKTWSGVVRSGTDCKEKTLALSDTMDVVAQRVHEQPEPRVVRTPRRHHTDIPRSKAKPCGAWVNLEQRLLYESCGLFRPWQERARRRINPEHARTRENLLVKEVQDRKTVVVTVNSTSDDSQAVLRHFRSLEDEDKEMVVVETHAAAPTACLAAQARNDERFMLIPLKLDPPPDLDFGRAVGALMASGQYIIHATAEDLLDAESRHRSITMIRPYVSRERCLQKF